MFRIATLCDQADWVGPLIEETSNCNETRGFIHIERPDAVAPGHIASCLHTEALMFSRWVRKRRFRRVVKQSGRCFEKFLIRG
jgi:hypothetical protein